MARAPTLISHKKPMIDLLSNSVPIEDAAETVEHYEAIQLWRNSGKAIETVGHIASAAYYRDGDTLWHKYEYGEWAVIREPIDVHYQNLLGWPTDTRWRIIRPPSCCIDRPKHP